MLFFLICAAFALFPVKVLNGAGAGVALCINVVIPSLLPFMLASGCVIKSNFARPLGSVFSKLMSPLCGMSPSGCVCFLTGIIGGYGAGAKAVCDFLDEGYIEKEEAEVLLSFCNNAGPLFVIGTVGSRFYGDVRIGIMLYCVNVLASLITGCLFCIKEKPKKVSVKEEWIFYRKNKPDMGKMISECAASCGGAIVTVCVFVITFAALINLMQIERFPALTGILEVTSGVRGLSCKGSIALPAVSAVLAWGGLSVQFQASALCSGKLGMKKYYAGKILSCVISYIITYIVYGDFSSMILVSVIILSLFIITAIIRSFQVSPRQHAIRQQPHS